MKKGYLAYVLPEAEKSKFLKLFPPKYERVIAHHVTYQFPATEEDLLPKGSAFKIVGESNDGNGVQALVVEVDGDIIRNDGGTYHITWSLSKGRKPFESNKVIQTQGFRKVDTVSIKLEPAFVPHGGN